MISKLFGALHCGVAFILLVLALTLPYLFLSGSGGTVEPMRYG